MTTVIETLFSAWGDPTSEGRAEKSDAALASSIYYADPNTPAPITDRDGYLTYIAQFGQMMPGATAEVVSVSDTAGHLRATVAFGRDGAVMMLGQYFAETDADGRITKLIGFTGLGEPK